MDAPPRSAEPQDYLRAAAKLRRWLKACVLCPRGCRVDRLAGEVGYCRAPGRTAVVNTAQLHHGEEPPISGTRGSGTVFFSGCTMGCVFCQNHEISHQGWGEPVDADELALIFLRLQAAGAHNLNLVTPTPHLPTILEALGLARRAGLTLPVVYNTSGYERVAALKAMAGLIEVYLPDYKYADPEPAARYSDAANYPPAAQAAIAEMFRQVGHLRLDDDGLAVGGLMVRHLVLPEGLASTARVMRRLAAIAGPELWVSLMSQYFPTHQAHRHPALARTVTKAEYGKAIRGLRNAGLSEGFIQGLDSAGDEWVPDFHKG